MGVTRNRARIWDRLRVPSTRLAWSRWIADMWSLACSRRGCRGRNHAPLRGPAIPSAGLGATGRVWWRFGVCVQVAVYCSQQMLQNTRGRADVRSGDWVRLGPRANPNWEITAPPQNVLGVPRQGSVARDCSSARWVGARCCAPVPGDDVDECRCSARWVGARSGWGLCDARREVIFMLAGVWRMRGPCGRTVHSEMEGRVRQPAVYAGAPQSTLLRLLNYVRLLLR
jgi:hypothetical protein